MIDKVNIKDVNISGFSGELLLRVSNFDAAIRRVSDALGGVVCGGVDTAKEINDETGLPYGPGGHTGYALERAIVELKRAHKAEFDRARDALAANAALTGAADSTTGNGAA